VRAQRDMCLAYFVCPGDFAIKIAATLSARIGIGYLTLNCSSRSRSTTQIANCKHLTIAIYSLSAVFSVRHF
jgi:hypothetical protein